MRNAVGYYENENDCLPTVVGIGNAVYYRVDNNSKLQAVTFMMLLTVVRTNTGVLYYVNHSLDGNLFNSFFETHKPIFSLFTCLQLKFYHLHLSSPFTPVNKSHSNRRYPLRCIRCCSHAVLI